MRLPILALASTAALLLAACGSDLDACDRDGVHVVVDVPAGPCAPAGEAPSMWSLTAAIIDAHSGAQIQLPQASASFAQAEDAPRRYVAQWAWPPNVTSGDQIFVYWQASYRDGDHTATAFAEVPATPSGCQAITATATCEPVEDAGP